ncbi:hypothetical protein, partial [Bosea sp. CRIB-10]|uniref:hypothetical protein n=1 Tax=Bosea sp. CRIB-10 TaxID=378404 RepID=UPI001AECFFA5
SASVICVRNAGSTEALNRPDDRREAAESLRMLHGSGDDFPICRTAGLWKTAKTTKPAALRDGFDIWLRGPDLN